jgi:hypothetical protein
MFVPLPLWFVVIYVCLRIRAVRASVSAGASASPPKRQAPIVRQTIHGWILPIAASMDDFAAADEVVLPLASSPEEVAAETEFAETVADLISADFEEEELYPLGSASNRVDRSRSPNTLRRERAQANENADAWRQGGFSAQSALPVNWRDVLEALEARTDRHLYEACSWYMGRQMTPLRFAEVLEDHDVVFFMLEIPHHPADVAQHSAQVCARILKKARRYYIGITEHPVRRHAEHKSIGRERFAILHIATGSNETASLEKQLLSRFGGHARCENVSAGGERASAGSPHFTYISWSTQNCLMRRSPKLSEV